MFKLDSKDSQCCGKKILKSWIHAGIEEQAKTWNKLVATISKVDI